MVVARSWIARSTDFAAVGALIGRANVALGRQDYEAALQRAVTALRQIRDRDTYDALIELQAIVAGLAGLGRDSEAAERACELVVGQGAAR
jgi:phosphoenolpyruvate-protein kinase (PTS system EI component)